MEYCNNRLPPCQASFQINSDFLSGISRLDDSVFARLENLPPEP